MRYDIYPVEPALLYAFCADLSRGIFFFRVREKPTPRRSRQRPTNGGQPQGGQPRRSRNGARQAERKRKRNASHRSDGRATQRTERPTDGGSGRRAPSARHSQPAKAEAEADRAQAREQAHQRRAKATKSQENKNATNEKKKNKNAQTTRKTPPKILAL